MPITPIKQAKNSPCPCGHPENRERCDRRHCPFFRDRALWLVLAYSEPPPGWGFTRSKSGKCWWRRIEGRSWAAQLGHQLAEQDIHGVYKRVKGAKGKRSDRGGLTPIQSVLATLRQFDKVQDAKSRPSDRTGPTTIGTVLESTAAAMGKAWYQEYMKDFTATTSHHSRCAALPAPITPATTKHIATSRAQEVLSHGSTANGPRKL